MSEKQEKQTWTAINGQARDTSPNPSDRPSEPANTTVTTNNNYDHSNNEPLQKVTTTDRYDRHI